jgi:hypothetical protein
VNKAPYWQLLSILFSSFPMTPELAATLYEAAFDLHTKDAKQKKVAGDALSGTVRNLKKHALIGTIGGPTFEAEVETERGKGMVRFILTRQGLESRGVVDVPKELRN